MQTDNKPADLKSALKPIRLFADLPDAALVVIAEACVREDCYRGQTIIEEGDAAGDMIILLKGRVGVQVESISPYMEIGINKLEAGEVIGEMSLIDQTPRSATIVALEAGEIVRLSSESLEILFESHPEWGLILMRNLAAVLASRLRMMNRRILNLMRARYL